MRVGRNNAVTLVWMFIPLLTIALSMPLNSLFSRETLFGALVYFHFMGTIRYPLNIIARVIIRRAVKVQVDREYDRKEVAAPPSTDHTTIDSEQINIGKEKEKVILSDK